MSKFPSYYKIPEKRRRRVAEGLCIIFGCSESPVGKQCERHAAMSRQHNRARKEKLRGIFIEKMGGQCSCCGENNSRFLTVEHLDNTGKEERQGTYNPIRMLKRAINGDFEAGLLCFNCNIGKSINGGVCPHEEAD